LDQFSLEGVEPLQQGQQQFVPLPVIGSVKSMIGAERLNLPENPRKR
jgi:hypothetical protein